jgi:REP element-mobilizing transposase RayT
MKYNPKIHHRRSIRLKGYDYSQPGLYFITLCTQNRLHLFGEIKNGEMILNEAGKIAKEEWEKTAKIRKNISLGAFIIMPNHFHAIISIDYQIKNNKSGNQDSEFKSPSNTIGAIIRGYKAATTKRIKELFYKEKKDSEKKDLSEKATGEKNSGDSATGDIATGVLQYAPSLYAPIPRKGSIWQRNYYEHIIRNEKAYNNITQYIINNPKNWGKDKFKRKDK